MYGMQKSVVEIRKNFSKYTRKPKETIVVMNHKKPVSVIAPLTSEEKLFYSVIKGKTKPDVYLRKMLGIGHQCLLDGKIIVTPMDIVMFKKTFG